MVINAESFEERMRDRDCNGLRITQTEVLGGGIAYCVRIVYPGRIIEEGENNLGKTYRIRKLTPRECWKLQGFSFDDCDKASNVGVSNSQLYRQAGNGIITNCVSLLFEHLYKAQYDPAYKCFDENFI